MLKFLILLLSCFKVYAFDYNVAGFLGYTQWNSTVRTDYDKTPYDLGLHFNAKLNDSLDMTLNFRYSGEENVEESLSYGFLSKHINIASVPLELQGGKFKYDFGLHGGNQNNPKLRSGLLPAQSIYWSPLRFTLRSAYGFRALSKIDNFELSAAIGKSASHDADEEIFAWLNIPARMLPFRNELNMDGYFANTGYAYLKYDDGQHTLKIGHGFIHLNDYVSGRYTLIGLAERIADFTFEAETILVQPTHKTSTVSETDFSKMSKGYSLSLAYNINDNLKTYVMYNTYERKTPNLPFINDDKNEYADYAIGISYEFYDNMLIRGEVHRSFGSGTLANEEAAFSDEYDDYYVTALNFTYFF